MEEKTLYQKAKEDCIRTLEDVCDIELFSNIYNGNRYCLLKKTKRSRCSRQSIFPDRNGLYPCLKHVLNDSKEEDFFNT